MVKLYIDPSFAGTGCFLVDEVKKLAVFNLPSGSGVKKSLEKYYLQAYDIAWQFSNILWEGKIDEIYMEAPFIQGWSSEGLHMLQYALLDKIRIYSEAHADFRLHHIYSITASYIKSAVTREYKRRGEIEIKGKIKNRNNLGLKIISELQDDGWQFIGKEYISDKSDDVITACLFWYLSQPDKDNKVFPKVRLFDDKSDS
jgi:hypothetical protein